MIPVLIGFIKVYNVALLSAPGMQMAAQLLDGKSLAETIKSSLLSQIRQYLKEGQRPPGLAVILVGDDPASELYVNNKRLACEAVGMHSEFYPLPSETQTPALLELIASLNSNPDIDGILVQLPLPAHIETDLIIDAIAPHKDVDGFHPYNIGRLLQRRPALRCCTPWGVMQLLHHYNISVLGMHAVVVGASNIVGRPLALELLHAGATVTICHRETRDLETHVRGAKLLCVATGHVGVIESAWISRGSIVVDIGLSRNAEGKLVGDLNFESAAERAAWITPVPGGVGPMTVATLLMNTMQAYKASE